MRYRDGADWWLKYNGMLPDYYVTLQDAKSFGYRPLLGNLADILPGKMITKGIYKNKNGHLPSASGRIWYEADINYTSSIYLKSHDACLGLRLSERAQTHRQLPVVGAAGAFIFCVYWSRSTACAMAFSFFSSSCRTCATVSGVSLIFFPHLS